jgi:hypothetical protein
VGIGRPEVSTGDVNTGENKECLSNDE